MAKNKRDNFTTRTGEKKLRAELEKRVKELNLMRIGWEIRENDQLQRIEDIKKILRNKGIEI